MELFQIYILMADPVRDNYDRLHQKVEPVFALT